MEKGHYKEKGAEA